MAVDASGRVLYVANTEAVPDSGEQYEMSAFPIDPATGADKPTPHPKPGREHSSVVTDPLGQFLYSPQNAEGGDPVAQF